MYFLGDNSIIKWFWAGVYLIGVAFICLLPPWEGYDEIAHYSYAQQVADTGEAPSVEQGKLAVDVEAYKNLAPTPYSTTPPFDENGGFTYRSWFSGGNVSHSIAHDSPSSERHFSMGTKSNWQAQHPELYYRLIAPLVSITAGLSWTAQLFILRVFSWSLAFSGLVISVSFTMRAIRIKNPDLNSAYTKIALAWPLLFPGFFPEFARLGNDSLILLMFSLAWAMLIQRFFAPQRIYWYLGLGALLGLGGLTKITFLPVSVAIFIWLLWMGCYVTNWSVRIQSWLGTLLAISIYFLFTGESYLANLAQRGSLSGLVELSDNEAPGALFWLGALRHPFEIIKGLLGIEMTFIWGGTASSAYPPIITVLPIAILVTVIVLCSIGLFKGPIRELAILALLIITTVISSLIYYLLVRIAVTGVGSGTPGWYLHTLIAPLSLLLAGGWKFFQTHLSLSHLVWRSWFIYMVIFGFSTTWLQLTLFTGCSFKTAESRFYSFSNASCFIDISNIYQRLNTLGYPALGLTLVLIGILLSYVSYKGFNSSSKLNKP